MLRKVGNYTLKWLHSNGFPMDSSTTDNAAEYGHLDILQWAYSVGCELSHDLFDKAAKGGQLNILKWLVGNQLTQVRSETCDAAAENDKLEVLAWLLKTHGCIWNGGYIFFEGHATIYKKGYVYFWNRQFHTVTKNKQKIY